MRWSLWILASLVLAASVSAQSLGEIARKEKKRRQANSKSGASVRVISESDVKRVPAAPNAPSASARTAEPTAVPDTDLDVPPAFAPAFSLPDRHGRTVSLKDLRGRPVLIDFWATWCGPCRSTMPEIERLHRTYRGRLSVLAINIEGKSPEVLAYLDEGAYSFQVLFDEGNWESAVADAYGVASIPRTFLLDGDGRIVYSGHPSSLDEATITRCSASGSDVVSRLFGVA